MTMWWQAAGKDMTKPTCEAALTRMRELGIRDLVVASTTGYTARWFLESLEEKGMLNEVNLVVVTHAYGFKDPGTNEMSEETRDFIQARGAKILTQTHLFANVERFVTKNFGGLYPGGFISGALRMFSEGTKVCVEIAVMALDAGLIPYGKEVMAVAGTAGGADTALVIKPAHARSIFEMEIREVICKPRVPVH